MRSPLSTLAVAMELTGPWGRFCLPALSEVPWQRGREGKSSGRNIQRYIAFKTRGK